MDRAVSTLCSRLDLRRLETIRFILSRKISHSIKYWLQLFETLKSSSIYKNYFKSYSSLSKCPKLQNRQNYHFIVMLQNAARLWLHSVTYLWTSGGTTRKIDRIERLPGNVDVSARVLTLLLMRARFDRPQCRFCEPYRLALLVRCSRFTSRPFRLQISPS